MKALLEVTDIGVRLGTRRVLHHVDLALRPGEILGLVGRNGAGKTTLLRVAGGALRPEEGRVSLLGRPLSDLTRTERARGLAVVPQETVIPFPFRALEIVLMGRSPHLGFLGFETRHDVAIAHDALASLGIAGLGARSISELSSGERQLVIFARALAQDPRVLLLDEPTAFLDLEHRLRVLARVRAFVGEQRAALLVSHDLSLAARHCDRIAILADGSVLATGPPSRVLDEDRLRRAFGVEATILEAPDGSPLVVPTLPGS